MANSHTVSNETCISCAEDSEGWQVPKNRELFDSHKAFASKLQKIKKDMEAPQTSRTLPTLGQSLLS